MFTALPDDVRARLENHIDASGGKAGRVDYRPCERTRRIILSDRYPDGKKSS